MLKTIKSKGMEIVRNVNMKAFLPVLVMGIFLVAGTASAADPVTLPDTGVDVSAYISAGILFLGGVVATAVGGYAAFLILKKALKWIGRALG